MSVQPTVASLVRAIEAIAPARLAESWDNVGLLLGDPGAALRGPVLLTIDLTAPVMGEAERLGAGALIVYHPPIFAPIKRLTASDTRQSLLLRAANRSMAIYAPHTALDAAENGLADWLARTVLERQDLKGGDVRALLPRDDGREGERVKIVTFVPHEALARVREALASAGAGEIGNYRVCSFESPGHGTFLGSEATRPAVGQSGRLEEVREHRLEMVCPRRALPLALATLSQFHPYEEPAVDVYPLSVKPLRRIGAGRRVTLDRAVSIMDLARRVKAALGVAHVHVADASAGAPIGRVGVCPGSGAELIDAAIDEGCHAYVTGEMKHHEVLAATSRGISLILAGHTATERPFLHELARRLGEACAELDFVVSGADVDPLVTV